MASLFMLIGPDTYGDISIAFVQADTPQDALVTYAREDWGCGCTHVDDKKGEVWGNRWIDAKAGDTPEPFDPEDTTGAWYNFSEDRDVRRVADVAALATSPCQRAVMSFDDITAPDGISFRRVITTDHLAKGDKSEDGEESKAED